MVPGLRLHMAIALAVLLLVALVVLLLVALGLAAGCGGGGEEATPTETPAATPTAAADQAEFQVSMDDNVFVPDNLTAKAGQYASANLSTPSSEAFCVLPSVGPAIFEPETHAAILPRSSSTA